jgi:hypothetical protein
MNVLERKKEEEEEEGEEEEEEEEEEKSGSKKRHVCENELYMYIFTLRKQRWEGRIQTPSSKTDFQSQHRGTLPDIAN